MDDSRNLEGDAATIVAERYGPNVEVRAIGAGAWSNAFLFDVGGTRLVIRIGDYREDFETDAVASGWRAPDLPTPDVIEIGDIEGGFFAISSYCPGEPLERLAPSDFEAALPSLLATLDAIRSVDISDTAGFGGWDHTRNAPFATWRDFMLAVNHDGPDRRTHGWSVSLAETPHQDLFDAGYAELDRLTSRLDPGRWLLHADLLERNVHVLDQRISGVFDWGCSQYGDFFYEIAWFEFWAPWHESYRDLPFRRILFDQLNRSGVDATDAHNRMRCAAIHIGLDHLAYNVVLGTPEDLDATARRLAEYV